MTILHSLLQAEQTMREEKEIEWVSSYWQNILFCPICLSSCAFATKLCQCKQQKSKGSINELRHLYCMDIYCWSLFHWCYWRRHTSSKCKSPIAHFKKN